MTGPPPTVPILMHDLQGKVEEPGTLVSFRGEQLFDGGGSLRDDAAPRLAMLAGLIDQIHPSGVRVTVTDPADADLARQRASVLQQWLRQSGQVKVAIKPVGTRGDTPTVDVMILR